MVIIFDPKFVIIDNACQFSIDSKIIWKCDEFLEMLNNPPKFLDEQDYIPRPVMDLVHILGWEFDISSTIYNDAKACHIVDGWNLLNADLKSSMIDKLVQPYFLRTVLNANGQSLEHLRCKQPIILDLLRFVFWYNKCSKDVGEGTFHFKQSEIKRKISRGLIDNVDQYRTTISYESDDESVDNIDEFMRQVEQGLTGKKEGKSFDQAFKKYMKEIPKSVLPITSELLIAGFSHDAGYKVHFDKATKDHDYDIIIENIPCQVKCIVSVDRDAENFFKMITQRITDWRTGRSITEDEVNSEIHNFILINRDLITDGFEQGVQIVFVDGTQTYPGFLLNQWASSQNIELPIGQSLDKSVNLLQELNLVNQSENIERMYIVIFVATAIDKEYRFSTRSYKIPVDQISDPSKILRIEQF